MNDRDTITLPREVVQEALDALEFAERNHGGDDCYTEAIAACRDALAAEQPKPEPVATVGTQSNAAWKGYDGRWSPPGDPIKVVHLLRDLPLGTLLYAAPPDIEALRRDAERYKLVLNWLWRYGLLSREKTRIDTPESYGDWFVLRKPHIIDGDSLLGYGKTEDAAIDAAMKEDKT